MMGLQADQILQKNYDLEVISTQPLSGGSIAKTSLVTTHNGSQFIVKQNNYIRTDFRKEANGIEEIKASKSIRTPHIFHNQEDMIIMEYILQGHKNETFDVLFGRQLAEMHKHTCEEFGFYEDNFIGATPQINTTSTDWTDFYFENRLKYQYNLAVLNGLADEKLVDGFILLEKKIHHIIGTVDEPPALLHGDLWAGNYLCSQNNVPVLIDPAVYYGHRETDLAMTKMFGGFSQNFYQSYMQHFPIHEGWQYRENIYLLYHHLNHLNLFGSSYLGSSIKLLWSYFD